MKHMAVCCNQFHNVFGAATVDVWWVFLRLLLRDGGFDGSGGHNEL